MKEYIDDRVGLIWLKDVLGKEGGSSVAIRMNLKSDKLRLLSKVEFLNLKSQNQTSEKEDPRQKKPISSINQIQMQQEQHQVRKLHSDILFLKAKDLEGKKLLKIAKVLRPKKDA